MNDYSLPDEVIEKLDATRVNSVDTVLDAIDGVRGHTALIIEDTSLKGRLETAIKINTLLNCCVDVLEPMKRFPFVIKESDL